MRKQDLLACAALTLTVGLAFSPAVLRGYALAPGDGSFVHLPLRIGVFESWRGGVVPGWNSGILLGTPLLASFTPGAMHPLMIGLSVLPSWTAFQTLVLLSVAFAAICAFAYARQLGASTGAAAAGGLLFGLGPAMLDRLADTPAVVAAGYLPLLLLGLERALRDQGRWGCASVALGVAGLVLSGSPDMVAAGGVCLLLRLAGAFRLTNGARPLVRTVVCVAAGGLLSAPQWLPTLLSLPGSSGLAPLVGHETASSFLATWLVRQVSHSPALALWIASAPLVLAAGPVRLAAVCTLLATFVSQIPGVRGLSSPALVLDLALAVGAALVLSEMLAERGGGATRRLRQWYLVASLAMAATLSGVASALGPLPLPLAGAVGSLAVAQIVFFVFEKDCRGALAHVFLLPLFLSFSLQPSARGLCSVGLHWEGWTSGSATRNAISSVIGWRLGERLATLSPEWPERDALDLDFGNLGMLGQRRDAGGISSVVPLARQAATGIDPSTGFATDEAVGGEAGRFAFLGVRFLQLPVPFLAARTVSGDGPPRIDFDVHPERPRLVPFPISVASAVVIESALSDAVDVEAGTAVATVAVRLASGRTVELPLRAGLETGEWARSRKDVAARIRHPRPQDVSVIREGVGEHYRAELTLPARYGNIDAVEISAKAGTGRLTVFRLALVDGFSGGGAVWASRLAGLVSDTHSVKETAATAFVRFFEIRGSIGRGRVVSSLRLAPDARGVSVLLRAPVVFGIDPRRTAVGQAAQLTDVVLPEGSRAGAASVIYRSPRAIDARGQGPGLLVVAEGFASGWAGRLDGAPVRIRQVNGGLMAVPIGEGFHLLELRYSPPGFFAGLGLGLLGLLVLGGLTRQR